MQDLSSRLEHLRRPRLLLRAARIGAQDYRRAVHLPRLLSGGHGGRSGAILIRLMELEDILNDQRLNEDSNYSILRHIDVLIALVAEAQIWLQTQDTAA